MSEILIYIACSTLPMGPKLADVLEAHHWPQPAVSGDICHLHHPMCTNWPHQQLFSGPLVLRFLQGYFGSPCLATGGASMGDMYSLLALPYLLTFWVATAMCGPALGPLVSGFSVPPENWRWSLWEILWVSGPVFLLLYFCLPETSTPIILLR